MEDFKLEGGIFHIFLYFTIVKHSFSQNVFFYNFFILLNTFFLAFSDDKEQSLDIVM